MERVLEQVLLMVVPITLNYINWMALLLEVRITSSRLHRLTLRPHVIVFTLQATKLFALLQLATPILQQLMAVQTGHITGFSQTITVMRQSLALTLGLLSPFPQEISVVLLSSVILSPVMKEISFAATRLVLKTKPLQYFQTVQLEQI
jgi:hypothetical protein